MIKPIGSLNTYLQSKAPSFGQEEGDKEEQKDKILAYEKDDSPIATGLRIGADKFQNAISIYPIKGLSGNRNSNFYEFLTMGMVPYITGSLTMMAVFNAATKYFTKQTEANVIGRKMALGVIFYGAFKNLSKKLIEQPIKARYGIDMNMPYKRVIHELPDSVNDKDLISNEYHKVFESVDFPRWDLLYDAKYFGNERNSYYDYVGRKMGLGKDLKDSDQIVKPKIKDIIVKGRTFSTFSSYLWAAVGVGIATQKPWDLALASPNAKGLSIPKRTAHFIKAFKESVKIFYNGGIGKTPNKVTGIASKALIFGAIGTTIVGNLVTLIDFKKHKENKVASTSLIDDSKAKVVC